MLSQFVLCCLISTASFSMELKTMTSSFLINYAKGDLFTFIKVGKGDLFTFNDTGKSDLFIFHEVGKGGPFHF